MKNALVPIEEVATQVEALEAEKLFSREAVIDLVEMTRKAVTDHGFDPETNKGRDAIKSLAYKVAKIKSAADDKGKELVAGWKEKAKAVDENRKLLRDQLDELRDETRRPVTEFEAAEKERQQIIESLSERIKELSVVLAGATSASVQGQLEDIADLVIPESVGEEMAAALNRMKDSSTETITVSLAEITKREEEQAELEKLRREAEERRQREELERLDRERKEREEQIAKEAKERAEREAKEREEKLIREKEEAEKRAEQERLAAAERERLAVEKAKQEERERAEREQREKEEAERLERAKQERAAANKKHQATVNNNAVADIVKASGVTEAQAKEIVKAIACGMISRVSINY